MAYDLKRNMSLILVKYLKDLKAEIEREGLIATADEMINKASLAAITAGAEVCEDCKSVFDPDWCADDNCGRDVCKECEIKRDNYEQEKSDRED